MSENNTSKCPFEHIHNPDLEAEQVAEITDLTVKLLDKRYAPPKQILRGVHPKSHGCVKATFTINSDLDPEYQVGLFAEPGKQFDAFIRFSNASAVVSPDTTEETTIDPKTNKDVEVDKHGSRGMAVKVLDVGGEVLIDDNGAHNQDFLMINQPVFAFANTEDYLRLERVLNRDNDVAGGFFTPLFVPDPSVNDEQKKRIGKTLKIVTEDIQKTDVGNALGIQYFSAAPFLFGSNRVMKFSVKPCVEVPPAQSPSRPRPDNYLRDALTETMSEKGMLSFDFMLQVRHEGDDFGKDNELIENASSEWNDDFIPVAKITILAPQADVDSEKNKAHCEKLAYTPWHSLVEHQPLGSINRLRKNVYAASAKHRDTSRPELDLREIEIEQNNSIKGVTIFPVLIILLLIIVLLNGCDSNTHSKVETVKEASSNGDLKQGWNKDEALSFYDTPQGSQLLPYDWFLALEQASNSDLFRDNNNIKHFGYIPQVSRPHNPDGLPVGFVKDQIYETLEDSTLVTALLSSRPGGNQNVWLGLTCAACHTSEINYGGRTIRIDGGPAQSDIQSFIVGLSNALVATTNDDAKLTRFAEKIIPQDDDSGTEKQALKTRVEAYTVWLNGYIDMNYGGLTTPYGYGRLDAFGAILNQVTSHLLEIPSNASPANAPVSYPFLWNTSQLDWVQWNGSVSNHIARNVGEVTGVFAHTILKTDNENERFYSSAKIENLDRLEQYMAKLDSPKWDSPLPKIDHSKAEKGKILYAKNCVSCHGIRDDQGHFPMTKPNAAGKQFIKTHNIPLATIRTDPLMAMNFIDQKGKLFVNPGEMRRFLDKEYQDAEKTPKVPRGKVLVASGKRIILKQIDPKFSPSEEKQKLEYLFILGGAHFPSCEKPPIPNRPCENPPSVIAYKARPLNGIWATAPYMHNGSMANLYQTLLPDTERETYFYVGSKKFDPKNVGFESNQDGNHFLFKTVDDKGVVIPGNSNKGHSGNTFTKTLDKNGQWRDFTDVERYQLIEYMKTL